MPPNKSAPDRIQVVSWPATQPIPTQEEVEARIHHEGYESFKWYDVPGMAYPQHAHEQDECLWILKGELVLEIRGQNYSLKEGDRIYLPAQTPHTARVPSSRSVTYIVGQKRSQAVK